MTPEEELVVRNRERLRCADIVETNRLLHEIFGTTEPYSHQKVLDILASVKKDILNEKMPLPAEPEELA